MNWNFFDLVNKYGLYVVDIAQVPHTTGVYRLFAANGKFIYVGKTIDLRRRLTDHFGPNEKNERIRGVAEYAIWEPTRNIEEAEEAEGFLYDFWVAMTRRPPLANKIKPPKSKLSRLGLSSHRNFNSRSQRRRIRIGSTASSMTVRLSRRLVCRRSTFTAKPRRWRTPSVLRWQMSEKQALMWSAWKSNR